MYQVKNPDGQLQKQHNTEIQITKSNIQDAGPSGHAVEGVGLRQLAC